MADLSNSSELPVANETLKNYPDERSLWEISSVTIFLLLIIATSVCGNLLVLITIKRARQLGGQDSNLFIVNLCVTDLASAVVVMGTRAVALAADLRSVNHIWCSFVCAANYCLIIVSMTTLSSISLERLIAVVFPLRHRTSVTRGRVKAVCAYTWLQGAAFGCVPVGLGWVHYDYWEATCAIDWHLQKQTAVYYVIVAFVANFAIPAVLMLVSYVVIIRKAGEIRHKQLKHADRFQQTTPVHNASVVRANRALKTITSLLVVILCFFIGMTPFCVTKLLKVVVADQQFVPPYANLTAALFQYTASMVNPCIYAIFRKEFREAFRKTLKSILKTCCDNDVNTCQEPSSEVSSNARI